MNMEIAFLGGLFGTYVINKFGEAFLNKPLKSKIIKYLTYAGCFLFVTIGTYSESVNIVKIVCYLAGIFIVSFAYEDDMRKRMIYSIYTSIILVGIQILAIALMFGVEKSHIQYSLQISIDTVEYIIALMLGRMKKPDSISLPLRYWAAVIMVPVFSLYFITLLCRMTGLTLVEVFIGTISILVTDFVIILLYGALSETYKKSLEQKVLQQENKYYVEQLQYMSESYNTIRSVKHDIKNTLNSIKGLAQKNNYEKIVEYIDLVNQTTGFNTKHIDTGNTTLDSILNFKAQEAFEKGISLMPKVSLPYDIILDPFDMSIIIGNMLDNAITAVEKIDAEKEIFVIISYTKGNLLISVSNKFSDTILYDDNGKILTSKTDKANHGIGINNIEKIVKKYNGSFNYGPKEDRFLSEVVIYF